MCAYVTRCACCQHPGARRALLGQASQHPCAAQSGCWGREASSCRTPAVKQLKPRNRTGAAATKAAGPQQDGAKFKACIYNDF